MEAGEEPNAVAVDVDPPAGLVVGVADWDMLEVTVPRSGQHKSLQCNTGKECHVLFVVLYGQNTNVSCLCVCFYICMCIDILLNGLVPLKHYPQLQGSHVREEPAATSLVIPSGQLYVLIVSCCIFLQTLSPCVT